jgi:hypothetical protein
VYITLKKYDGWTKPIPRKGSVEGLKPAKTIVSCELLMGKDEHCGELQTSE